MPVLAFLYDNPDYTGQNLVIRASDGDLGGLTAAVSSLRISGSGYATVYDQPNYSGASRVFIPGSYSLIGTAWDNRISSIMLSDSSLDPYY
ncbi:conserved protein of unknown function [Rhodovastum atsumiense]|uniref:Beta/gamma crystallin 'Greek key' domain-containing protein n=1 Tax=Rhodovastum atsumiense TaxID=504468 RepID=A0A5M6ILJ8_9PROT|nr:hypothetical protein F1189_25575 [Rhodovastum atsumiense]CAH2601245.1 conserved protein of unknown function [Rhodovastum atsumiense]